MRRAVYAGSFDPITKGHLWMIKEGSRLFDELIVAVGINPEKKYLFSVEERLEMLQKTVGNLKTVKIDHFNNQYLVNYTTAKKASYILRGIRDIDDYSFERNMRHINSDLKPNVMTVFLIPPRKIAEVSSSFVKGLVGPQGWQDIVKKYIPEPVLEMLIDKLPVLTAGK